MQQVNRNTTIPLIFEQPYFNKGTYPKSTHGVYNLSKDEAINLFNNEKATVELVAKYPDESESAITNINDLYYYLDNNFVVVADLR